MELFTYSVELARIVFILGAVLAMLYKKYTGVTPGGIIVPAFLTLLLDQSFLWFVAILIIAAITRLLYRLTLDSRALSRHWQVFTNISISAVLVLLAQTFLLRNIPSAEVAAFGFVIPGLIAANSLKYGSLRVFKGALSMTAVAYSIGYLLTLVVPFALATSLTTQLGAFAPLQITAPHIFLPASLAVTGLMMYKFDARTGGYLLAPFVALLASQSLWQMAAFVIGVVASYGLLQLIMKYSLLVGLERFLISLILAAGVITLTDLAAVRYDVTSYLSTSMVLMVAMAVIVNDLCLQRKKLKAAGGISLPIALAYGLRMVVR